MSEPLYSAVITKPGHGIVRLGPLGFQHVAEHMVWDLCSQLHSTSHPAGTTIEVAPFDESLPHLPLLPRDSMELANLMDGEQGDDGSGASFPDLFSRLHAQEGYEVAARLWGNACSLYDSMHAEDVDA